jgi:glycine/D-amino acid oxidase-like deaminating enzyme
VVRGRCICALETLRTGPRVFTAELMDQLYDIAIVGGGLAGSALAKSMAEKRFRVIVLEREKEFWDRVRGLVNGACGQEVRWWRLVWGARLWGDGTF